MSSPPVTSLVRRSRALPIAIAACTIGLMLCAVTYAVAGETVRTRDIELLDPLPDGVVVIADDVNCAPVATTGDEQCRRHLVLKRPGTSSEALADELAERYRDRGFELNPVVAGNGRTYFGVFGNCGPQLFVGGMQMAGMLPNTQPVPESVPSRRPSTTAPTTTLVPTTAADAAVDPNAAVSTDAGATGDATTTETAPEGVAPTEPPPTEPALDGAPDTTVVVGAEAAPPTTFATEPDDTELNGTPGYPGAAPSASIPDEFADIVTVELSEPFPGSC